MARMQDGVQRNAIDMLMEDHKRVQKLLKDFEKTDRADEEALRELVETACMELQIHSMLEEEIFYPALRGQLTGESAEDRLNRAEVEHEAADELVAKLLELTPDDPMYVAYFSVLGEYVKLHIREEEKELFPAARKAADLDLERLGEDMQRRREELFAQIESDDSETETEEEIDDDDDDTSADVADLVESAAQDDELEDEQQALDPRRTRH